MEQAWRCEDEEEAYGVELLLRRAGIDVQVRDDGNETWFDVTPADATRAAVLESKIARHFAGTEERSRSAALDLRERRIRRVLVGVAAVVALVAIAV